MGLSLSERFYFTLVKGTLRYALWRNRSSADVFEDVHATLEDFVVQTYLAPLDEQGSVARWMDKERSALLRDVLISELRRCWPTFLNLGSGADFLGAISLHVNEVICQDEDGSDRLANLATALVAFYVEMAPSCLNQKILTSSPELPIVYVEFFKDIELTAREEYWPIAVLLDRHRPRILGLVQDQGGLGIPPAVLSSLAP